MRKEAFIAVVLVGAGAVLAPAHAAAARPSPAPKQVMVLDDLFSPFKVTVPTGGSVEWVWSHRNLHPHNVRLIDGPPGVSKKRYRSPTAARGFEFQRDFPKPGVYRFLCTLHPFTMRQEVVVRSTRARTVGRPSAAGASSRSAGAPLPARPRRRA